MKKSLVCTFLLLFLAAEVFAADWTPTPLVINSEEKVHYDFDGTELNIPFNLSGKPAKIWLIIETKLPDAQKPVAIQNGFKGWHYVNGIDTTVYVSSSRTYEPGTGHTFPWDGNGNERQMDTWATSGAVAAGEYTYYLWGYDNVSTREIACDFLPFSYWWEAQYIQIYPYDEQKLLREKPLLAGTVPFYMTGAYRGGGVWGWPDCTIIKFNLGNDPFNVSLAQTSYCPGYGNGEIYEGKRVAYGAGVFDPNNYNKFYFSRENYWEQRQTVVKWDFVTDGVAIQDLTWGDYENVEWFHPGNKGDYTLKSPLQTDGTTVYMLDGGQNPLMYQHDKFRAFPIEDPTTILVELTMDEFYMPNQKPWSGAQRSSSEINRFFPNINAVGQYYVSGEWTCLTELVNFNRLIEGGPTVRPYAADGSGYVVWANSNGDFYFDKSMYPDPGAPEHLWACIMSDPRNYIFPRMNTSRNDRNGLNTGWGEWMGLNQFGVYTPDGTGVEISAFADVGEATGVGTNQQKRGFGDLFDVGGIYDGIYHMMPVMSSPGYQSLQYLKTTRTGFDSDKGIITNLIVGVEEESPVSFSVAQNVPNPFNPSTTITYTLAKQGMVSVDVFNVAGQKVATLVNESMSAGNHSVVWDASGFSAGVYFYSVKSGEYAKTMKMTLVK